MNVELILSPLRKQGSIALLWRQIKMKRHILSLGVVMAFLCPVVLQAKITYKVIDLGTLGGFWSWAHSINGAGQIVGSAQNILGLGACHFI